jgi:alpha-1,2-mannosyltransferase
VVLIVRGMVGRVRLTGQGRLVVSGGFVATTVWLVWGMCLSHGWGLDLRVYRAGGVAWTQGFPLYVDHFILPVGGSDLPFTYPPITAVMFSALSVISVSSAITLMIVLNLAALVVLCLMASANRYGSGTVALVIGLFLAGVSVLLEPVRETLWFGQVNLVLGVLVAADCLLPRTKWPRGLLIGLAAAIKLTPAFFVLFFLPRRQWRPVLIAVASFVGFGLLGFVLAPSDTKAYWFGALLDPSRIGRVAYANNQSILGVLERLPLSGTVVTSLWVLLSLIMVALSWIVVVRARRAGDELTALLAVAVAELLISPISWGHHWVWIVPALLLLTSPAWRRWEVLAVGLPVLAVFGIGPAWWLPSNNDVEKHWMWWQHLIGAGYVLIGVGFLVLVAFLDPCDLHDRLAEGTKSTGNSVVRPCVGWPAHKRRYRPPQPSASEDEHQLRVSAPTRTRPPGQTMKPHRDEPDPASDGEVWSPSDQMTLWCLR